MKAWRRILWNGVTAVSLVGCGVCAVLWARCYLTPERRDDALMFWKVDVEVGQSRQRVVCACTKSGALHVDCASSTWPAGMWPTTTPWRAERAASRIVFPVLRGEPVAGFRFWTEHRNGSPGKYTTDSIGVSVPYWAMVVGFGVVPAVRFWRKRRREGDRVAGRCVECGYDLRGSGGRCPECGVMVENTVDAGT